MDMTMKRSMVVVAAVFAAMSTSALANDGATKAATQAQSAAVKLSDAQLDEITAGAAVSEVVIFNRGQAEVGWRLNPSENHSMCINCVPVDSSAGTSGTVGVVTPKEGKEMIFMPVRQFPL